MSPRRTTGERAKSPTRPQGAALATRNALVKRALTLAGDIGAHMRFDEAARRSAALLDQELQRLEERAAAVRLELEALGREQARERAYIAGLIDQVEHVANELEGTPEWAAVDSVVVGDYRLGSLANQPRLDGAALFDTSDEALSVTLYTVS